ncbi:MAG: hypothetical protein CO189_02635 [candidate division Zixibacteria bacterium CG_4_9_14_3_um_filter_46_8]|nr:MAG: hypothetical protein CO189_02635 [candidate division Zixibacteria bacterium CG_4_9_14_3_um_filter_46_8]
MKAIKMRFYPIIILLLISAAAWSASEEDNEPVAPRISSSAPKVLDEVLSKKTTLIEVAIENGRVEMITKDGRRIEVDLNATEMDIPEIPEFDGIINRPDLPHKMAVPDKNVQVTTGKTKIIEEAEEIEHDIIVLGSDVIVRGAVDGDILAINGDITVTSTGRVNGDVSSIGGKIEKESGAVIRGEIVETPIYGLKRPDISFPSPLLIISALFLLFALVAASLAPKNVGKVQLMIIKGTLKSLLLGYVYFLALPFVIVILAITIIGIPVAILVLPLLICAALILGFAAFSIIVGEKFLEMINTPEKSPLFSVLLGATLCQAVFVVGALITIFGGFVGGIGKVFEIVGLVVFVLVIIPISFGASITTFLGTRPKDINPIEINQQKPVAQ